jgi:hypothetical protein
MATGCDVTPKGVPLGVHMRNRKLHNIRPSGDFSLEVTSSNVTRRDSIGRVRACATGSCAISDQTSQGGLPPENM